MKGKKELLILIIGPVLFIIDLVTDCCVAVQFKRQGENTWFGLTVTFIIVPLFIVNYMAFWQANKVQGDQFKNGCCASLLKSTGCSVIACFLQFNLAVIDRHLQEFEHWKRKYLDNSPCGENYKKCNCAYCGKYREVISESNKSAYKLASIRYVETLLESIPQWCFQVYVMLSRWSFPWYTVLSAVIALLSSAWSHMALEKARALKDGHNFNMKSAVLYYISQLVVLAARLFSIVTCAYAIKSTVFGFLAIFWFCETVLLAFFFCCYVVFLIFRARRCEPSTKTMCKNFFFTIPLTFFVSETALETLGFTSMWIKMFLFVAKSLGNQLMLASAYTLSISESNLLHLEIWMPIAESVFGIGSLVGLISLILRHVLKRRARAVPDGNSTEAQIDAYHIPESGTIAATNSGFVI